MISSIWRTPLCAHERRSACIPNASVSVGSGCLQLLSKFRPRQRDQVRGQLSGTRSRPACPWYTYRLARLRHATASVRSMPSLYSPPGETPADLWLERANLVGAVLGAVSFGEHSVLRHSIYRRKVDSYVAFLQVYMWRCSRSVCTLSCRRLCGAGRGPALGSSRTFARRLCWG